MMAPARRTLMKVASLAMMVGTPANVMVLMTELTLVLIAGRIVTTTPPPPHHQVGTLVGHLFVCDAIL